jgi:DNA-binding SARP family transcriptional activator/TolB-like protein
MAGASAGDDERDGDVRWTLHLLGPLRVEGSGGETYRLTGRRERALLAYLALAPDFRESRRNLTVLLWGEDSDNLTLDNLRTCLWSLRKALGDEEHRLVMADREWIALNPELLDVDVRRLVALLDDGAGQDFDRLFANGEGMLLEGLELDTITFQDWLRDARAQLAADLTGNLQQLMSVRWSDGDAVGALAASQRILQLDPFNETALRTLLEAYAATGRRHLALQAYQRFADRLRVELDVEPEAETKALVQRLSDGSADVAVADATAEATAPPAAAEPRPAIAPPLTLPSRRWPRPVRVALIALAAVAVAGLGALVTIGAVFWRVPELAPAPFGSWILDVKHEVVQGPPSIAVLPFNSYGEAGAAEFADAIAEGLASALSVASEMFVVSRSSVLGFKGSALPPQSIAQRLGVRYLLEGSVTKFGESVTVRADLVDTDQGGRVHSVGEFERPLADFFSLQREITLEVVTALQVRLTEGEQERISISQGTKNYQAWLLEAQGQKHLRALAPDTNMTARRSFERALALDPKFTGALTGLAWTYLVEAHFGTTQNLEALFSKAAALAEQAYKLDDKRASTYALIGSVALFAGKFDVAVHTGERAVELEYNDSDAAALLAMTLTYAGEPRRAIPLIRRAMQLKPYPPRWYFWLHARAHRLSGRYKEAIRILEASLLAGERSPLPMVELTLAYVEAGELEQARVMARELKRQHPEFQVSSWGRAPTYKDPERTRRDVVALAVAGLTE